MEKPLITPQTKVGELLERFPELEDVLIEVAPAFAKLRSPILRRTVARVTSLSQAAKVGGVSVVELVRRLRLKVGQPDFKITAEDNSAQVDSTSKPDWVTQGGVVASLDARPMIDAGEQPIGRVLRELDKLEAGQVYELVTPFEPAPLIDKAREKGMRSWTVMHLPQEFHTYFSPSQ